MSRPISSSSSSSRISRPTPPNSSSTSSSAKPKPISSRPKPSAAFLASSASLSTSSSSSSSPSSLSSSSSPSYFPLSSALLEYLKSVRFSGTLKLDNRPFPPLKRWPDVLFNFYNSEYITPGEQSWLHEVLKKVSCNSCGLTSIDPRLSLYDSIEQLSLSDNQITDIPEEIFQLKSLKSLFLPHNVLSSPSVNSELLSHFSSVVEMNLSYNEIDDVSDHFQHLVSLQVMNFSHNKIKNISNKIFGEGKINHLIRVDFSFNSVEFIPPSLLHKSNRSLQSIEFHHNSISTPFSSSSPYDFTSFPSLTTVDLSDNKLKEFPIFPLSLQVILIRNNNLSSFHPSLFTLHKLSTLDIHSNRFSSFPFPLYSFSFHLHTLILNNNDFNEIPPHFGLFEKLSKFSADGNPMKRMMKLIQNTKISEIKIFLKSRLSKDDIDEWDRGIEEFKEKYRIVESSNNIGIGKKKRDQYDDDIVEEKKMTTAERIYSNNINTKDMMGDNLDSNCLSLPSSQVQNKSQSQIIREIKHTKKIHFGSPFDSNNNTVKENGEKISIVHQSIALIMKEIREESNINALNLSSCELVNNSPLLSSSSSTLFSPHYPSISSLSLHHNPLLSVPLSFLTPFTSLTSLVLSSCQLSSFPSSLLNAVPSLSELNLGFNFLSNLHCDIGEIVILAKKLEILYLNHNKFTRIPPLLSPPSSPHIVLKEFHLNNNKIDDIPPFFFLSSPLLRVLELSNNNISYLPPTLSLLSSLQSIQINGNSVKNVPQNIIQKGSFHIIESLKNKLPEGWEGEMKLEMERRRKENENFERRNPTDFKRNDFHSTSYRPNGQEESSVFPPQTSAFPHDSDSPSVSSSSTANSSSSPSSSSSVLSISILESSIASLTLQLDNLSLSSASRHALKKNIAMENAKLMKMKRTIASGNP